MSDEEEAPSVITCDMEGRIETFSDGAERIFGWRRDEVVGKKRVSLFSPGEVVLGHVAGWLKAASTLGAHETRTAFVRKDGSRFAAKIRITPTMKGGVQIGYCGVTRPLDHLSPDEAMPPIGLGTRIFKWLVVTRAPFLTAVIVPVLIGAAWARRSGAVSWTAFVLALIGAVALHVAANTWNDYFDWKSGTDQDNNDYFLPFSGGSRAIELGLITPRALLVLAWSALAVAAAAGASLIRLRGLPLACFGAAGFFAAYFYTAPPLRLAARRGLGELAVALAFGPLATAGTVLAVSGRLGWGDFVVGLPVGLLTCAILYINEFPDAESDARAGKNHLVVTLGKRAARWLYPLFTLAPFALIAVGFVEGKLPAAALAALAGLPLALWATAILFRHYGERALVRANAKTIQLQALAGILLAVGLWIG
jgi:1,4-dihydroxy-2-naphthoate octaprenyltransferase